jgi:hypothetical protein
MEQEKRRRLGMDLEVEGDAVSADDEALDDEESHDEGDDDDDGLGPGSELSDADDEPDGDDGAAARGARRSGRLIPGVATSAPAAAAQWFGQDLFDDPNLDQLQQESGSDDDGAGNGGPPAKAQSGATDNHAVLITGRCSPHSQQQPCRVLSCARVPPSQAQRS